MMRYTLLGICLFASACFAACGDSDEGGGKGDGSGGDSGEAGDAGAPSGGRGGSTGGTSSGGTSSGGTSSGGTSSGGTSSGGTSSGGTSSGGTSSGGTSSGGMAGEGGAATGGIGGEGGAATGGEAGAGSGGEGGASCVPTEPPGEVCDDIDNDCNGVADDIDVGNDGIHDCLNIVLIGGPGALSSSNFQTWLEEQGTTVSRIHADTSPAELVGADLAPFDIAILDSLRRSYGTAESAVLSAWVRAGGGLMSMNGHTGTNDLTYGNSLLVSLGVEHVAGLRSGNVTTFHSHPLTVGLTSVSFQGGYRLGNLTSGEGSTVVAEVADGPVGLALTRGSGRAFIWGDEWVQFDSEWQALPEIKTFWVNALGWLSSQR